MTNNELPVQIDDNSGFRFVEASGVEAGIEWKIEGIEGDNATIDYAGSANSLKELRAQIAKLQKLEALMAQAEKLANS